MITATYRAYNDFIAEFCEYDPNRFIGIADIPAHSPDAAAAEVRRMGKNGLGLKGALCDFFNGPAPIWHEMWEPMWAAGRGGGSGAVVPHRRGPRHHHGGTPERRGKAQKGYPEGFPGSTP